ncbi:disintegrin and metalloproteinase domain-containing protein 9 [Salminus brasiliensis]|uniref:disintegrin and metalloproteinase domain-containing protein 9 n=1 Tax=Salminus brasiliensis TaxID=930266 RepID=UPI003B83755C
MNRCGGPRHAHIMERERSRTGARLFLLSLTVGLFYIAEGEDLFHQQTSKLSSYQIVTPQLVSGRWKRQENGINSHRQSDHSDHITYSIEIENIVHFLHLRRNKDFLSPDFAVVSHDVHKKSVRRHTGKPASCHYHGRVEGREDSLVALSTCHGLRGVIFIGNKSYALEPVLQSTANEHLLFPLKDNRSEPFVCGTPHSEDATHDAALSMTSFLRRKRNLPLTRFVELVLVVDNQRFNLQKGNTTAVREEMVQLANLLDTYFQQLNIRIVLVGLEIFETKNPFDMEGSAGDVLGRFVSWRKTELVPRIRNDMAQLIVGRAGAYSGGVLGMAFVGTVCSANSGGGINVYSNNNLQSFSTVLAHEMGHNLGMNHDDSRCNCNSGKCIMASTASGSTLFSTCSGDDFEQLIQRGGGVCLRNQPSQDNIITVPRCGNGVQEQGEECDCGPTQSCTNKCCDAATCTLTRGSTCAAGLCCKDCQLLVSGTPCRESVNECDLPEFCPGGSSFCPPDTYLMDGLTCAGSSAYCFEGRCQTLDYQCQQLFGSKATKADDKCFSYVNTQGTSFGNCGYSGSSLAPCSVANSMCGKIQCTNFDTNYPPPGAVISIENIEGGTISCRNADFKLGSDVRDPAYVKTGTVCAAGKVCLDFQCTNSSVMTQSHNCDAMTDCHGNGVCNNKGHCHCYNGWGPPNCNKAGRGGSIDSGPAQIDYSLRDGLLIFFLLVVPILVVLVIVFLYVFRRDLLDRCLKGPRSKRHRSANTANAQRTGQPTSTAQRATSTQPPVQIPPTNPQPFQPPRPAAGPGVYASWDDDEVQPTMFTVQPPRQGPGVPKPIPPRPTVT